MVRRHVLGESGKNRSGGEPKFESFEKRWSLLFLQKRCGRACAVLENR
jgi:hypothetical protein